MPRKEKRQWERIEHKYDAYTYNQVIETRCQSMPCPNPQAMPIKTQTPVIMQNTRHRIGSDEVYAALAAFGTETSSVPKILSQNRLVTPKPFS